MSSGESKNSLEKARDVTIVPMDWQLMITYILFTKSTHCDREQAAQHRDRQGCLLSKSGVLISKLVSPAGGAGDRSPDNLR